MPSTTTATTERRLLANSMVARYLSPQCVLTPQFEKLFAGVRGHVRNALVGQPSSISLSDAMTQVNRFRQVRQTKS
jgi:hypothetical protein